MKNAYGTLFKTEAVGKVADAKEHWGWAAEVYQRQHSHKWTMHPQGSTTAQWEKGGQRKTEQSRFRPGQSSPYTTTWPQNSFFIHSINRTVEHPRVVLTSKIMEINKVLYRVLIVIYSIYERMAVCSGAVWCHREDIWIKPIG